MDIVAICPELRLCYLGILSKCYEILEGKPHDERGTFESEDGPVDTPHNEWGLPDASGNYLSEEEEEDDDDDPEDDDIDDSPPSIWGASEGSSTGPFSDNEEGQSEHNDQSSIQFRLREILFYDDKISVFKARHGAL